MKDIVHEMHVVAGEFQPEFYRAEYPDVAVAALDPLRHFCEVGWQEGRNPHPNFDVINYLLVNPDVAEATVNPFYHYLFHGRAEGRPVVQAVRPSVRTQLLFGLVVVDWVEQLRDVVNGAYYQASLAQNLAPGVDAVAHFAYWGWREGKNPSVHTDIRGLRTTYAEASRLLINPCIAEIAARRGLYTPSLEPNTIHTITAVSSPVVLLGGSDSSDLNLAQAASEESEAIALVRRHFDYDYYLKCHADVRQAGIDAFDHYYYTGWRENRDPNTEFETKFYRDNYAADLTDGINPFLHYLKIGRANGYLSRSEVSKSLSSEPSDEAIRDVIRGEFSESYYLSTYSDIRNSKVGALEHFVHTGWREHRNPNSMFDTGFYVSRNSDIRDLNINPFWHYLVAGRAEGRLPIRPGGYRRDVIEKAHESALKKELYTQSSGRNLSEKVLLKALQGQRIGIRTAGVLVSLSHDCYVRIVGGTQIFISDEQKLSNANHFFYLHISPKRGQLKLAAVGDNDEFLIAANGVYVGAATLHVLLKVLSIFTGQLGVKEKFLVVHSFFGFTPTQIVSIANALIPRRSFFWVHDYSAVCEGYNLLRNDLQFCGAPAPTSMTCRVCRYGNGRLAHIEQVSRLFAQLNFEVLAPSKRAADVWRRGVQFKVAQMSVHPHWVLQAQPIAEAPAAKRKNRVRGSHHPRTGRGIRLAFIGYPNANKGWPIYKNLIEVASAVSGIKFYHLASAKTPSHPACEFVVTEVTPNNRGHAIAKLIESEIDVLCMLSMWPETFSFVSYEAIMAGIRVVCLSDSGNVAALEKQGYRVSVFKDAQALSRGVRSVAFKKQIEADRAVPQRYNAVASGATLSIVRKVPIARLPRISA
jgi:hypothetical protein